MKLKRIAMMVYVIICIFIPSTLAAQVNVEPVYQEVYQGDNLTVNITVYPQGSEVYSASYTLYFNNTLLKATSWAQGPFLSQDGASTNLFGNEIIKNTLGKIEYAESRSGTDVGVTGSGVLTTITFQAIGEKGISPLDISDLEGELLYSVSGSIQTDINNGTCNIEAVEQATPTETEPTMSARMPTEVETTETEDQTTPDTPAPQPPESSQTALPSTPATTLTQQPDETAEQSGFASAFAATGLLIVSYLILRKSD